MPLLRALTVAVLAAFASSSEPDIPSALKTILKKSQQSALYRYPTDLTRNIVPKALHSHNDYWRDVHYYSALSVGAISVEADVWLYNGTLYVGHEESALTIERTFQSLYVKPILATLQSQNPSSPFVTAPTQNGVFDTDSGQTLYLWVDVKTDGAPTFSAVIKELEPLRSGGWLTTYSKKRGVIPGAVTVIGTGNTPLDQVQGVSPRDYFSDAPLPDLATSASNITNDVSPIASTDFEAVFGTINAAGFTSSQLSILKQQVQVAKSKGIGIRYWDTPAFPLSVRNLVWSTLWNYNVTLINVDDLQAAAGFSDWGVDDWGA